MSPRLPASAEDAQRQWAQTLPDSDQPEQTLRAQLAQTRRMVRSPSGEVLRRLGYELGRELGRGGLGLVNAAKQQVFDREVAVKRLLSEADREAAIKFFAEALITAQLEHPHIVPIHDLMMNAGGQLQLVMKRVEGVTWRELLHPRQTPQHAGAAMPSLDEHLEILLKVCDAVMFAHGRGILHRDLKPENVMVGNYGEVLVMDWGCAVAFGEHEHHPVIPRVDEIVNIAGTPSYMAPEMILIQPEHIGPASDVYLLGGMLYEVLTRQKPHRGAQVRAVLRDACFGSVVHPKAAAPDRDIPAELADICLAALAKDVARRTASVASFAAQLRAYRQHAQAVTLVEAARTQLAEAAAQPRQAAARLRKAVSNVEQALEIWTDWRSARALLCEAVLANARCQLAGGAAILALEEAKRAARLARELADAQTQQTANALAATARAVARSQQSRQRQLRWARRGAIAATLLLFCGLVVFLLIVRQHELQTAAALAKAEAALAAYTAEHAGRGEDQKTAAPALVAQARKALEQGKFPEALAALDTAIAFDGSLPVARQLQANLLAASKRYEEAIASALRWQELVANRPEAAEQARLAHDLLATCRVLHAADHEAASASAQQALAELFEEQRLFTLAAATAIAPASRLAIYRKRIDAAWPGAGQGVYMEEDGRLVTSYRWQALPTALRGRREIRDLEPLRGLPFARLDVSQTSIRDLEPLRGMPLQELDCSETAVADLAPLHGMQLHTLSCYSTRVRDLSALSGMPLRRLTAYGNPDLSDLSPLRGMPLQDVNLLGCGVRDLGPLAGMQLTVLRVSGFTTGFTTLRGMPLKELTIFNTPALDFSVLAQAPLKDLDLQYQAAHALASLPGAIENLWLMSPTPFTAAELSRFPLQALTLTQYNSASPIELRGVHLPRLEKLRIEKCQGLDLLGMSAPQLKRLECESVDEVDLSPLAHSPLEFIRIMGPHQGIWPSLAAFKTIPTLATIEINQRRLSAAEFWKGYDPQHPERLNGNALPGASIPSSP